MPLPSDSTYIPSLNLVVKLETVSFNWGSALMLACRVSVFISVLFHWLLFHDIVHFQKSYDSSWLYVSSCSVLSDRSIMMGAGYTVVVAGRSVYLQIPTFHTPNSCFPTFL